MENKSQKILSIQEKKSLLSVPEVDRKRSFQMDTFELSILKTTENATVRQSFSEPIFYNLLEGKKLMRFDENTPFEYLPGNTMIVPPNNEMEVSFPGSSILSPTNCLSLQIDRIKIADSLTLLNERHPRLDGRLWQLPMQQFSLFYDEEISQLIFKLYSLAQRNTQEARIIAELTLTELLVLLFQNHNVQQLDNNLDKNVTLGAVIAYIKEHLETNLTIDLLAQHTAMSASSLYRIFKKELHLSPMDYVNKERIEKAKRYLQYEPHLQVAEIGYMVGFTTPNYFARIFKQLTKMTPSEFRVSCI